MPSNVRKFAILSYLSLLFGIVQAFMMFDSAVATAIKLKLGGGWVVLVLQVAVIAVIAVLYFVIAFGRMNWARWLLLVVFVLGLPFVVLSYPSLFARAPVQGAISLIQTLMQAVALYYVFTGNAKPWFRKEAAA